MVSRLLPFEFGSLDIASVAEHYRDGIKSHCVNSKSPAQLQMS